MTEMQQTETEHTTLDDMVNRMFERSRRLTPLYAQAVRDADLQVLILVRSQFAATVREADEFIANRLSMAIDRRLRDG